MIITIFPAILCVIGALTYVLAANPKASEMGRIAFFVGLLVLALVLANWNLRLT